MAGKPRTAGRPALPARERRSGLVRFRTTAAEDKAYAAAAAAEGKSVSEYVRAAANRHLTLTARPEVVRLLLGEG
jgi:uncharacterized protein (DUF1778 family)